MVVVVVVVAAAQARRRHRPYTPKVRWCLPHIDIGGGSHAVRIHDHE